MTNWNKVIHLEEQTAELINQKDVCLSCNEKGMNMWMEVNDEMGTMRLFMPESLFIFLCSWLSILLRGKGVFEV